MTLVTDKGFQKLYTACDVILDPSEADDLTLDGLMDRPAIAIVFTKFQDGRGFSTARRLREMGYRGRLRAQGPLIADQYAFLLACGFNEVEIPDDLAARQPEATWLAAAGQISRYYQRGVHGVATIADARRASGSEPVQAAG